MNAEEPTAAYYTPSMVHALQRSIANRISHETNPEKLSEISRILDASSEKESFEARYQKAKVTPMRNGRKNWNGLKRQEMPRMRKLLKCIQYGKTANSLE